MVLLCAITVIVLLGIALKIYIKLNTRWNSSYACLVGKTAIVTGSNAGLGYATALDFAMRGARVILACRNMERGNGARNKIVTATGNENVIVKILDMASFDSVRAFAKDIVENENRLDILVNNAGVYNLDDKRTKDGLLEVMQVNHLSPFLLTHLLLDKLKSTSSSRIVNVSSFLAKTADLRADQLDVYPSSSFGVIANNALYSNSKLCNILFSIELAKRLDGSGVGVYCLHPGATKTEIQKSVSGWQKFLFKIQSELFFWTAEEGAQTTIYCSLSKDVIGDEGELFGNCRKIGTYEAANDVVLRKEVWRKSEVLTKITETEKIK